MRSLLLAQELVLQCTASDPKERPVFAGILDTLERLCGELRMGQRSKDSHSAASALPMQL